MNNPQSIIHLFRLHVVSIVLRNILETDWGKGYEVAYEELSQTRINPDSDNQRISYPPHFIAKMHP